jgi:organic hydroperoxide reductase OsmC/OhrA
VSTTAAGDESAPETVHLATIDWQRGKWAGAKGKYSREHLWHLVGGAKLKASDSPAMLPKAFADRAVVNPENMFVAAVASAHMLSWLNVAFGMGIEVASYLDRAHGVLSETARGEIWVSEVILYPKITFDPHYEVTAEAIAKVHELAHARCFIARSIKATVTVRPD